MLMTYLLTGTAFVAVLGFAAWQYERAEALQLQLEVAEEQYVACDRTISLLSRGREIDNAIPDDLNGFLVPLEWMLPLEPLPGTDATPRN